MTSPLPETPLPKLLPCPLSSCGGAARLCSHRLGWQIVCLSCGLLTGVRVEQADAIERWNTRSPISPAPAAYEPLTKDAEWRKRCDRCGWTLAESPDKGCAVGDCSYRGDSKIGFVPSPERELRIDLRACEAALALARAEKKATC